MHPTQPSRQPRVYTEPTSLENAIQRHRDLVYDLNIIQMQMSDETRKVRMGVEFGAWRTKAAGARVNKIDEILWLKEWIIRRRAELLADTRLDRDDPSSLIAGALFVLKRLHQDGVDLDDKEFAIMNALEDFLTHIA
jgi:hypothetical protein